jgi:hypothetical protein
MTKTRRVHVSHVRMSKSQDLLTQIYDIVSCWGDMSTRELLFQRARSITQIQFGMLVVYKRGHHSLYLSYQKVICFRPDMAEEMFIRLNHNRTHTSSIA